MTIFLVWLLSLSSEAQTARWQAAGQLSVPRRDHSANLLPDGTVAVIAGLGDANGITAYGTADLYDPQSGMIRAAGKLLYEHGAGASVTTLQDGRLLIVGGHFAPSAVTIYDHSTRSIWSGSALIKERAFHSATLLRDGKVLLAGGQYPLSTLTPPGGGPWQSQADAEVFDPAGGTFTAVGQMVQHRAGHRATLLANGRVLITGGTQTTTPGFGIQLGQAEAFDPTSGAFTTLTFSAPVDVSVGLSNGKVLLIGANYATVYDPANGSLDRVAQIAPIRPFNSIAAVRLADGRVLICGGGPVTTNAAEIYDPVRNLIVAAPPMLTPRQQHTATLLPDGRVLVIGGYDGRGDTASIEIFTPGQ